MPSIRLVSRRSRRHVPLDYVIGAAIEHRGPFRSRLLLGRGFWDGAGLAEVTRQAE